MTELWKYSHLVVQWEARNIHVDLIPTPINSKRLWPRVFTSASLFDVRAPKISLNFILTCSNMPIFSEAISCVSLTMIYWLIRKNTKRTASSPGS